MTDLDQAKRFLELLDPNAEKFTFFTVGEGAAGGNHELTQTVHAAFEDVAEALLSLNAQGAGIFVTINETDGSGKRKAENIVRIRALWQDDDKSYQGDLPLEPSIVVETSPGKFHRYWLCDLPADGLTLRYFHIAMKAMVERYGADSAAKDLARVLRLPGFAHNKGKPTLVNLLSGEGQRYSFGRLMSTFLGGQSSRPIQALPSSPSEEDNAPIEWEMERPKLEAALKFVSGSSYENWFKYGGAIHDASAGSAEGRQLWDEWAITTKADNYDAASQERYWSAEFKKRRTSRTSVASIYAEAKRNGWNGSVVDAIDRGVARQLPISSYNHPTPYVEGWSILDPTPPLGQPPRILKDDIADQALTELRKKFERYEHKPTDAHWKGLQQIARVIERMALRLQKAVFSVSFLPAGMGKTSTLIECVKVIAHSRRYWLTGTIIFLARLEEIRKLAAAMNLHTDDFAVLVGEGREENKLGRQDKKTSARVLFTTQAGLEARSRDGKKFEEMEEYYYRGRPRHVRIWDEAILPSKIHTLSRHSLGGLVERFSRHGFDVAAAKLDDFCTSLREAEDKAIVTVPGVGIDFEEVKSYLVLDDHKDALEALETLEGRSVRVKKDYATNSALDYEDILPSDLAPMLILDASGLQRKTYELWYHGRKDLEFLDSPQKTYTGLTIHHWNQGSGKYAHMRGVGLEIAEGVAKAINEIPAKEPALVVHLKKAARVPDMEEEIRSRITNNAERVSFCNWGRETATNDYAHIKHVFLAGVPQYQPSQYEGAVRSAKGAKTTDITGEDELRETRHGEIAHRILQAANRGMMRKAVGSGCPADCHLYVVFPTHKALGVDRSLLNQVFPGASIKEWRPMNKISGHVEKLLAVLGKQPQGKIVTVRSLADELGIDDASNVRRLLNHRSFVRAIDDRGMKLGRPRGAVQVLAVGKAA